MSEKLNEKNKTFPEIEYSLDSQMARVLNINLTDYAPTNEQLLRHDKIRQMAKQMAELLGTTCPPSRERSLAITHLEESVIWAIESIRRIENNGIERSAEL